MKNLVFATIIGLMIMSSCAGVYKPTFPKYAVRDTAQYDQGVEFFYRYRTFSRSNNKLLERNLRKQELAIASVKIINHTDEAFILGKDMKLYSKGEEVEILGSAEVYQLVKFQPAWGLLYLLLAPIQIPHRDLFTHERTKRPVGFYVAPILAGLHIMSTSKYNRKFGEELNTYYLKDRPIRAGDTVDGLIVIPADKVEDLVLR